MSRDLRDRCKPVTRSRRDMTGKHRALTMALDRALAAVELAAVRRELHRVPALVERAESLADMIAADKRRASAPYYIRDEVPA